MPSSYAETMIAKITLLKKHVFQGHAKILVLKNTSSEDLAKIGRVKH